MKNKQVYLIKRSWPYDDNYYESEDNNNGILYITEDMIEALDVCAKMSQRYLNDMNYKESYFNDEGEPIDYNDDSEYPNIYIEPIDIDEQTLKRFHMVDEVDSNNVMHYKRMAINFKMVNGVYKNEINTIALGSYILDDPGVVDDVNLYSFKYSELRNNLRKVTFSCSSVTRTNFYFYVSILKENALEINNHDRQIQEVADEVTELLNEGEQPNELKKHIYESLDNTNTPIESIHMPDWIY